MIIYIQPIFIPDEKRFLQNELSIKSFCKYLETYPYNVKVIFGGWAYNDELWSKIINVINEYVPTNILLDIVKLNKNYGKAFVVNKLYNKIKDENFKYFLTADSDIIFDTNISNMFQRLEDIANKSVNVTKKHFGYISLQQTEECAHLPSIHQNKYSITNRYKEIDRIVYPNKPSGIAGGCLFINKRIWDRIGGYKVMGVYAGEDAYFLLNVNSCNYSYQVSLDISIIHPYSHDSHYHRLKASVLSDGTSDGKNKNLAELNKIIKKHDEYWDKRNS